MENYVSIIDIVPLIVSFTSWKDEDIDKMHCYREAIKGVSGSFILYPGERAVVYTAHNAAGIYEGVGALPLKPEAGARPVLKQLEVVKQIVKEFVATGGTP
jgi:predicted component of viral defense system (DUF524 family)